MITRPRIFKAVPNSSGSIALREYCEKHQFIRKMPTKEQYACDAIIKHIDNVLPQGGNSLYIGTATPFCITNGYKLIWYDNLLVADRLRRTSDKLFIRLGDAINRDKAIAKGNIWQSLQYMNKADIKIGPVTGTTYAEEIERIAKRCELLKVILMTSGSWEGTAQYHKIDQNFKDPSIELTNKYKHIHIVSMVTFRYNMKVLYLNNGKQEEITGDHYRQRKAEKGIRVHFV